MNTRLAAMTGLFSCTIDSDVALIGSVCKQMKSAAGKRLGAKTEFCFELIAHEFITNAIIHGNRGDCSKKVCIGLFADRENLKLMIADDGPGFDWKKAKRAMTPSEKATSGRGLSIGALYAKKIKWNQAGNIVSIWIPYGTKNAGKKES